jgi:hypothetical protein
MRVVDQQRTSSASSWEKDLVLILQGPGWVLGLVWMGAEKFHWASNFAAPTTHHLYSHYFN